MNRSGVRFPWAAQKRPCRWRFSFRVSRPSFVSGHGYARATPDVSSAPRVPIRGRRGTHGSPEARSRQWTCRLEAGLTRRPHDPAPGTGHRRVSLGQRGNFAAQRRRAARERATSASRFWRARPKIRAVPPWNLGIVGNNTGPGNKLDNSQKQALTQPPHPRPDQAQRRPPLRNLTHAPTIAAPENFRTPRPRPATGSLHFSPREESAHSPIVDDDPSLDLALLHLPEDVVDVLEASGATVGLMRPRA